MQKPSPELQIGSRTISRVLYHPILTDGMATVIPLGAQLPVPSSNLPGSVDRADPLPYLVLLRTGLAELVTSPCRLVGSYPTVSPLPASQGRGRFVFCGTFRKSPFLGVTQRLALWSPDFPRKRILFRDDPSDSLISIFFSAYNAVEKSFFIPLRSKSVHTRI